MLVFNDVVAMMKELDNCALYYLVVAGGQSKEIDVTKELGTLRLIANYGDLTKSIFYTLKNGNINMTGSLAQFLKGAEDSSLA